MAKIGNFDGLKIFDISAILSKILYSIPGHAVIDELLHALINGSFFECLTLQTNEFCL